MADDERLEEAAKAIGRAVEDLKEMNGILDHLFPDGATKRIPDEPQRQYGAERPS